MKSMRTKMAALIASGLVVLQVGSCAITDLFTQLLGGIAGA